MNETFARRSLADICSRLYDRGLTVSAGGNMSVRTGPEEILITPSGVNKGMLSPEDMVRMDIEGEVLSGGKPSIEHGFHLALYRRNPRTNAVVHCHPLYCTALAVMNRKIRSGLTPEGVILLGDVPMVDYETPGSEELIRAVEMHSDARAMLMRRHGALTQGKDLIEAYNRMEELEFQAKLQMLVGRTGNLPRSEIEKLVRL
ncbi:MAG: class II aldolase/adducin family protein [Candidatus Methanomethylophilaceae archaeon]|jgi:L-fuculose-phosphate aldolase|nr:class II aldolase/adducin family protein [Candidatus Methanomethylophilaceae archaeon]NLF33499.1 class II aldolase/adducin family protein [Thermoplasmatales archaeon]